MEKCTTEILPLILVGQDFERERKMLVAVVAVMVVYMDTTCAVSRT